MNAPTKDSNTSTEKSLLSAYAPAVGWIAGLIIVIMTLVVQMFTINHGTSGQLSIDTGVYAGIWWPLLGGVIFALFYTIWAYLQKDDKMKFIYLYVLVGLSYLLSNVALFYSMRQVTVSTT